MLPQSPGPRTSNILLLDAIPEEALERLKKTFGGVHESFEPLPEGQLARLVSEYQVVLLSRESSDCILTKEVLQSAHRLLAVGFFGILTNQVDTATANAMGIPVFTAPYQQQNSICEMVIALIVLLSRQIGDRSIENHKGIWNKTSTNCHEVRGKTLGIVGYGHAGSQLGVMAEALSLRVVFYDRLGLMPIGRAQPMESMEKLLETSDFVSLHIASTSDNDLMFGAEQFAKMKQGSYLINTSHCSAVDLTALENGLRSERLAGCALDVFPTSDPAAFATLSEMRNVILTPSIAANTVEACGRKTHEVSTCIERYLRDGTTTGSLDFPNVIGRPLSQGICRIACIHKNVRGVLRVYAYSFRKSTIFCLLTM